MIREFPYIVPRHAFSPRQVARAGAVWRAFQEAAVEDATARGWDGARLRAAGSAFVVRTMTVVHHREVRYGERIGLRTWVGSFSRGVTSRREHRLVDGDELVVEATQEWVHVSSDLRLVRASEALLADFAPVEGDPPPRMPEPEEALDGPVHPFGVQCWITWMDPLGHVNHPTYVDWCDEALARIAVRGDVEPTSLVPVAEWLKFRLPVGPLDTMTVETRLVGRSGPVIFTRHRLVDPDGRVFVEGRFARRLADGRTEAFLAALRESP